MKLILNIEQGFLYSTMNH